MNEITTVDFHGQPLMTFEKNRINYVVMKPIAEAIGLDWTAQFRRIKRDEVLSATVAMMAIVADDEKLREMVCLPIEMLHGWLMGVESNRVKPELRESLLQYKRECYRVLHEHWTGKAVNQVESYWFSIRPHWQPIRTLVFQGFTYRQVSERIGRSVGSVRRCVRAMVNRGLMNPTRLAQTQRGAVRYAAKKLAVTWGQLQASNPQLAFAFEN